MNSACDEATNGTQQPRTTRQYSRDELFEIAYSLKDLESIASLLKKLQLGYWSQFQPEVTQGDLRRKLSSHRVLRSLSNHGPSGNDYSQYNYEKLKLVGELKRMIDDHSSMTSLGGSPRKAIVKHQRGGSLTDGNYQSLASMDRNSNDRIADQNQDFGRNARHPVGKSLSHGSWLAPGDLRRQLSRPTHLFGPLRREDGRRSSGETINLMHSYAGNRNDRRDISLDNWTTSGENEDSELIDETPVQRIAATCSSENNGCTFADDEDDFDITNLLSITVLSDIKTIPKRQDSSVIMRQSSNLTKPAHQSKSHDLATKKPVRSRTSLEINYDTSRRNQSMDPMNRWTKQQYLGPSNDHSRSFAKPDYTMGHAMSLSGPESLLYNWQLNHHHLHQPRHQPFLVANPSPTNHKMAPISLQPTASKPLDEKAAQIIETFKAQIKARVESDIAKKKPEDHEGSGAATTTTTAKISSQGKNDNSAAGTSEASSKVDHEAKNDDKLHSQASKVDPELNKIAKSTLADTKAELQNDKSPATSLLSKETQSSNAKVTATSSSSETSKKTSTVVSCIPRLISLHNRDAQNSSRKQSESTLSTGVTNTKANKQDDLLPELGALKGLQTVARTSSPSVVQGRKFVSQYKELRGKSLADEVSETISK